MKKTLALLLAMAVLLMGFPMMSVVAAGTDAEGYTLIETAADFELIRENPAGKYKLVSDIDLGNFTPIDNFSGELIGDNANDLKTIDVQMVFNKTTADGYGLFSYITGAAVIKNIEITGSINVALDQNNGALVGGFVGSTKDLAAGAIIDNCKNSASITLTLAASAGKYTTVTGIGGIIGKNDSPNLTLSNLSNSGKIDASAIIAENTEANRMIGFGGIVGNNTGNISNCENSGDIIGSYLIGGIVGLLNDGMITNCKNSGNLTSVAVGAMDCGGIAGRAKGTIKLSSNTGTVIGYYRNAGGIVGASNGVAIEDCFNLGNVSRTDNAGDTSAGIVGGLDSTSVTTTITRCYNAGATLVGIIGHDSNVTVTECYNVGAIRNNHITAKSTASISKSYYLWSSDGNVPGATWLNSAELFKDEANMPDFDFENTWIIEPLSSYKYPQLRNNRQAYKEYIEIATAQDFELIRNDPAGAYKIVADINLDNFTPIDNFSGELIGDSAEELRTITIASTSPTNKGQEYYGGLFKIISGSASIQNIKLEGTLSVFSDGNYNSHIGGFAGAVIDGTKGINITNCVNDVDITVITASKIYLYGLGGFIGTNGWYLDAGANGTACSELVLENLVNYGTLSAEEGAGIGRFYAVGGIAGSAAGTIKKCANFAEISQAGATQVGGILGSTNGVVIEDSFNVANLINTGSKQSAGIVCAIGIPGSTAEITRCFHNGSTRFGIAGFDAVVTECYSIYGGGGGLDNHITSNNANVSKSYFYYPSPATVDGATHATLEQMKQETFLTDFDFENTWIIDAKSSYPYPQLRANRTAYEVINEIEDQEDFKAMNGSSESFKLMKDIELTGDYAVESFSGNFNGDGYTITIKDGTTALFDTLTSNAVVENFNIEGNVTAPAVVARQSNGGTINNVKNYAALTANATHAGVFVGDAESGTAITNCGNFADITISTTINNIGGIAGYVYFATIENCVNKGNITSTGNANYIGGIVGQLRTKDTMAIKNCMNVGDISAAAGKIAGGLVGSIPNAAYVNVTIGNSYNAGKVKIGGEDLTNANAIYAETLAEGTDASTCYYLTSGTSVGKAGNGKTSDELKEQSTFNGWEFSNTAWLMPDADSVYKYPQLAGLEFDVNAGETKEFPYEIATTADFKAISTDSKKLYYKLTDNIELTGEYAISSFSGDLDGNGKTITITNGTTAIFTETTATAEIYNLTLEGNVTISATKDAILAKVNAGTISDCKNYATLTAVGNEINDCGVFAGENLRGTITRCVNYADLIFAGARCGGIVGDNNAGIVSDCGNYGDINQGSSIAGIVGQHSNGTLVSGCYNTGTITGDDEVGGIIGRMLHNDTKVENCYNAGNAVASGGKTAGGIIGAIGHSGRNEANPYTGNAITNCYNAGAIMSVEINKTAEWAIYGKIINNSANPAISGCAYLAAENTEGEGIQGLTGNDFDSKVADFDITLCGWNDIEKPTSYSEFEGTLSIFASDKISVADKFLLKDKYVLLSAANANFGKMGWALGEVGFIVSKAGANDSNPVRINSTNSLGDFSMLVYGGYITEGEYTVTPYAEYTRVGYNEETQTVEGETITINAYIANP